MADQPEQAKSAQHWTDALTLAKKEFRPWEERGAKIVKRYRDDRTETAGDKRYNILWSNVRTLLPAVYAKKPKAQADRRYKDADPIGRTAAQILERCLQYEIDHYSDYDAALKNSVQDRLLPGRGVAWIRYEEHKTAPQAATAGEQAGATGAPKADAKPQETLTDDAKPKEALQYECSPCDYVFWKDFRHSPARTWEEVTWVGRRVYLSRDEGNKRFTEEKFRLVPLTHEPVGLQELRNETTANVDGMKKGIVWEIWDKPTASVVWIGEGCGTLLDEKADPLELDGFFPCPKPLYATLTTDTLVPVPDYAEYQDQAKEMDELTMRISMLTQACKVVGLYDASSKAIARLLNEGTDNTMIPVDTWAMFAEKGGIKGAVDWLPLDMVIQALAALYQAREACKQVIYEITGISDIIRGATNPNETLGAQEIKANYAGLRLKETQSDVARFASDLLRMKAQIICSFYRQESMIEMSGIKGTNDAQYADQAIALLQNEPIRNFRIEVATDSLVELDEREEQASRTEFISASSQFLERAVPAAQAIPEIAPLLGEMLLFFIRSFRAGRPMEAAFEEAVQKLSTKPQQPKQPSPEELKAQQAQQALQAKQQADAQALQAKQASEAQAAQQEAAQHAAELAAQERADERKAHAEFMREQMKQDAENNREAMRQQNEQNMMAMTQMFNRWKAELDAATKIEAANIASKSKVADAATATATSEIASEVTQGGV